MNISGMFNTGTTPVATGGSMSNPSFMMAASGAVIDRPTIMVAGERGPEVILPLKRGAARVTGGESSGRSIVINANINAMDSASFSAFAEKNRGVFERQIVTSVSQNPNIRRRMRKAL
jgi:phage-related minor tail protein